MPHPSTLIIQYRSHFPRIDPTATVLPNVTIIGDVEIGARTSIWFGSVLRGDVHEIRIGSDTNVQDCTVIHGTQSRSGTYIESGVTIGHAAIVHACTLRDGSFVGMGACILDTAVVGEEAMVAAGSLVPPGLRIPPRELWGGNPARKMRDLRDADLRDMADTAKRYVEHCKEYSTL